MTTKATMKTEDLNWTDMSYTLTDIDANLCISTCFVKIEHGMQLQSFLDQFMIKKFQTIYSIRAFKMKDNEDITEGSTYGEEITIPVSCPERGSIIPLYGVSHIFKTVEEMMMAFPRFVEVQEELTVCSNNLLVHLKPGDHLELVEVKKSSDTTGDKLLCHNENHGRFYLNASNIGRFKTLSDPHSYNISDVLRLLKLPQILKFGRSIYYTSDSQSAEPDSGYSGMFLLVGLQKSRAAVICPISLNMTDDDDNGYILALDSDLFKHLKYHIAFNNDCNNLVICDSKKSNSCKMKKSEQHSTASDAEYIYQITDVENNSFYSTYYRQATALSPSTEGYAQYLYPESTKNSSITGEKFTKKMNAAIQSLKNKLKLSSAKELVTICKNITPTAPLSISQNIYPVLNLASGRTENVYNDIGDVSLEGKSRFFSSAYATANPNAEDDTVPNNVASGHKSKEFIRTEKKSRMYSNNLRCGTDNEFNEILSPIPDRTKSYEDLYMNEMGSVDRVSTLKVSGRRSSVLGLKSISQTNDSMLQDKVSIQNDCRKLVDSSGHNRGVNPDVATDQRKEEMLYADVLNVHRKIVNQDEVKTDKDNTKDEGVSSDIVKQNTVLGPDSLTTYPSASVWSNDLYINNTAPSSSSSPSLSDNQSSEVSTTEFSQEIIVGMDNSSEDSGKICDNIKGSTLSSSMTLTQKPLLPPKRFSRPSLISEAKQPIPPPRHSIAKHQKYSIHNRPPLPIPLQLKTTPTTTAPPISTTTSATASSSTTITSTTTPSSSTTTTPLASPQHKLKEPTRNSLETASVKELCIHLEKCGLQRLKDICEENCLDGPFFSNLPEHSLLESPFTLSSIELMKFKMMMEGWRPKMV